MGLSHNVRIFKLIIIWELKQSQKYNIEWWISTKLRIEQIIEMINNKLISRVAVE